MITLKKIGHWLDDTALGNLVGFVILAACFYVFMVLL